MIPRKSITWRLTLIFAALSTTVFILVGTLASYSVERHFAEEDLDEINGKLELIQYAFDKVVTPADIGNLPQKLNDAMIGHHALSVTVYETSGKILYTTRDADFPTYILVPKPAHYKSELVILRKWDINQHVYRGLSVQMATTRTNGAPLNVAIALDIEHHQKFITRFKQSLWMSLSTGIVITVILGWIAARKGLSPIRDFDKIARRVSASRLNERIPVETLPKELVDLGLSFNDMLQRLQDSFRRLSDFSSDIAHELRTPVSNLMTQSHVALSKARTLEEYQEILYSNIEDYDRLSRMIADMLFLAKAENGLIVPNRELMALDKEVDAVIEFYEPLAEEKNVRIVRTGTATMMGDQLMMRRALSNLLSNAIRHTSNGQQVNIDIQTLEPQHIRLRIENPGEPISKEHLSRIFDRFYRVDPSRQRNTEGAGLGLAITKSIIESHGGEISVSVNHSMVRFDILIGRA
ncbi:MAG: heavy metal sensor histidine kinase [Candidatus Methylopumilus sp.]|jgi:two-component system heavy metal sensor histidine kinase CusS